MNTAKPDVNGLPYGVSATNSNGDSVTGSREYFSHASGNTYSGIMLNDVQNPYNPKSGGVMLNTSSFMGSSYTHWTTSMVWEQAYEKLIPNYNNVLPKVYTDGTLVSERNLDNSLDSGTLEDLRRDWYEMCNAVRIEKGYSAYTYDEYFKIGEEFFQKEAEKTMQKGETEIILDFDKPFRPIGVTPYERCLNAHIHEWMDDDLEYFKGFFEQSSCGAGFMTHDYMVIAFMEIGGRLFYSYTTFHDVTPLSDTAETVLPQPESPPVLEINPADNEMEIAEPEIIEEIVTEPPYSDPEYTDPESEYLPLIEAFDGEVLTISASSPTRMNIFDTDLNFSDEGSNAIAMKVDFIMTVVETAMGQTLTSVQKSILDRVTKQVYKPFVESGGDKKMLPTLIDFYEILLHQEEIESKEIATALELYVKGSFSTFSGQTNIDIKKKFLVIDIMSMGEQLKTVGIQVILEFLWQRVIENKKRGIRTWVYVDEFSMLFNNERSGEFFAKVYKSIRKHGGITTITLKIQ